METTAEHSQEKKQWVATSSVLAALAPTQPKEDISILVLRKPKFLFENKVYSFRLHPYFTKLKI